MLDSRSPTVEERLKEIERYFEPVARHEVGEYVAWLISELRAARRETAWLNEHRECVLWSLHHVAEERLVDLYNSSAAAAGFGLSDAQTIRKRAQDAADSLPVGTLRENNG